MAQAYLRTPPSGDQRPEPLSDAVVRRAAQSRIADVMAWLKPRLPTLTEDEAVQVIAAGIKAGGSDGFRTGVAIKAEAGWPIDMDACLLLRDCCEYLAFALRVETRAWALRVGIRFPGADKQAIEWIEPSGRRRSGTIVACDHGTASAMVEPKSGLLEAGPPKRVYAESVIANVTTGEYAVYHIGKAAG